MWIQDESIKFTKQPTLFRLKMLNNTLQQSNLSYEEYQRYARQIIIKEIQANGQNRLKNASVICIGAGGLSAPALIYLAACGIGRIGIVDNDNVELSNLQRQIIYRSKNIAKKKAEVACENLLELNKLPSIKSYNKRLTQNNIADTLSDYEIIIDGTDNFKTRYLISQYCYRLHKIHIYGAIEKFIGHVSVFNYQNSISYYNLHNKISYRKLKGCNESGVINTLAGITGLLQATEAMKIITGIGEVSCNQLIMFNMLDCSVNKINVRPIKLSLNQSIISCKTEYNDQESCIRYISAKSMLDQKENAYKLIDIRTPLEFQLWRLSDAINIPLSVLKAKKSIKRLKELLNNYRIVIYCDNSTRSYVASQILNSHSIKHYIFDNRLNKEREGFEPSLSKT